MKIPQSIREVIEKGPLAHFVTLGPDGTPQITVVWVGIEGDEFVMGHLALHQKIKIFAVTPELRSRYLATKRTSRGCENIWSFTVMRE